MLKSFTLKAGPACLRKQAAALAGQSQVSIGDTTPIILHGGQIFALNGRRGLRTNYWSGQSIWVALPSTPSVEVDGATHRLICADMVAGYAVPEERCITCEEILRVKSRTFEELLNHLGILEDFYIDPEMGRWVHLPEGFKTSKEVNLSPGYYCLVQESSRNIQITGYSEYLGYRK